MADAKRSSSSTRGKKKKVKTTKEAVNEVVLENVELANAGVEDSEPKVESRQEDLQDSGASEEKSVESVKARISDEYLIQCYFDKSQNQFVASVLEFGNIKASGTSKPDVIRDCENRLESHLNLLKRNGESIPETLQSRQYPEVLQVPVSQGLYRRLDLLSRQEKVSLDQLVIELISGMVEKRLQAPAKHQSHVPGPGQRPQQSSHHGGGHRDNREGRREGHREPHRDTHREKPRDFQVDEDNFGNQKRGAHPQQNRPNRNNRGGRNFHKTMESRENFLEYVRNLEKGNWKKR
jgi:predicted RNase H-like HicB family nuclease